MSSRKPLAEVTDFPAAGAAPLRARAGPPFLLPSPAVASCHTPTTLSLIEYNNDRVVAAPVSRLGLLLADRAEIETKRAQFAVKVRSLHADPLGELTDLAVAEQELLLQIRTLELLACLAQRQRQ